MDYTKGQIYIVNLTTLERVEAQYCPLQVTGTRTAKLAEIGIPARNNPQYQFVGGAEEISIRLDFTAEDTTREEVIKKINFLRAFTFADGRTKPAPFAKIVWGDMFKNDRFIIKSVAYDFNLFNQDFNFNPDLGICTLTLAFAPEKNTTLADIIR